MLGFDRDTRPKANDGERASEEADTIETASPAKASTRSRSRVTARPVGKVDSQVVERATWMMKALTVLDDPLGEGDKAATAAGRSLVTRETPAAPIMLVDGDAATALRALPPTPPKRAKRHWLATSVTLGLVAVLVGTALTVVTPLARGQTEGLAVGASGPLGLPVALDVANQAPSGQWVAVIGAQPAQEIGGGAAPGTTAPGSAGLPVKQVTVNKTTSSSSGSSGSSGSYISAPPFTPWPPANGFVTVPGYHTFTVYGSGGYYWWSFGQCTWWAQATRRDENLMRMGNAQYWAAVARSRGYYVSSWPKPGATVVFQPGVQGAGGAGHVAHVVKVYPNGWFLVSEMNFYWDGGGWGRVDYRLAHVGWGVQFIY
ncbi:MAG TPA: CHAP domain-containing protein [Ktedonobacterales bacterium]